MTYPGRVEVEVSGWTKPAAPQQARANPHNLKGFLDAFKAILAGAPRPIVQHAPSLTQCEEFA
jgi:hypothetical protein